MGQLRNATHEAIGTYLVMVLLGLDHKNSMPLSSGSQARWTGGEGGRVIGLFLSTLIPPEQCVNVLA